MGGWALLCFALFYWLLDVKGTARGLELFSIFGMNAITLYVASDILAITLVLIRLNRDGTAVSLHEWIHASAFASWLSPQNASLAYAVAFVGLMYLLGWAMWRKKWFLKVCAGLQPGNPILQRNSGVLSGLHGFSMSRGPGPWPSRVQ
jgi:predicted acyltransferase